MTFQFEAKLPRKLPEALNVYALDKPKVSNASLLDLAKKFGLTGQGKDFISSSDSLGYLEGRWGLEVNRVRAPSRTPISTATASRPRRPSTCRMRARMASRASSSIGPHCSRAAP